MTKTDKSHEADSNVQLPQWWRLDWYPICSMNVVWGKSLFPTWIVKFTVYEFCFFIHFCIQLYLYLNQTEECPNGEISVQGQPLLVKHRFCIFWLGIPFCWARLPLHYHLIIHLQKGCQRSGLTPPSPFNSASATCHCLCLSDRQVCLKCLCIESK